MDKEQIIYTTGNINVTAKFKIFTISSIFNFMFVFLVKKQW